MTDWKPPPDKPLERVKRCHKTDCDNGLHCFLKDRKRRTPEGTCMKCGTDTIDWARIHRLDPDDLQNTIEMLKTEHVRHEFWCDVELTGRATNYARRLGRLGILDASRRHLTTTVGRPANGWDGRQTPWENKGHVLHYAQHATASCCRRCIEVWYGIAKTDALSAGDIDYLARLMSVYITTRIPDLADHRMRIPRKVREGVAVRKAG